MQHAVIFLSLEAHAHVFLKFLWLDAIDDSVNTSD